MALEAGHQVRVQRSADLRALFESSSCFQSQLRPCDGPYRDDWLLRYVLAIFLREVMIWRLSRPDDWTLSQNVSAGYTGC